VKEGEGEGEGRRKRVIVLEKQWMGIEGMQKLLPQPLLLLNV
jgi:hypothetical protein